MDNREHKEKTFRSEESGKGVKQSEGQRREEQKKTAPTYGTGAETKETREKETSSYGKTPNYGKKEETTHETTHETMTQEKKLS